MAKSSSKYAPLYMKLKVELARKIRTGEYAVNQQLPTTAEMMQMFSVSDGTVKRIMRELVQEGLVYSVNGKGSYVCDLRQAAGSSAQRPERLIVAIVYGRRPNEVIGNLFYSGILQGVEEELSRHGLGLELINLKHYPFQTLIGACKRGMFSAVVVITTLRQDEVAQLAASGCATLSLLVEYPRVPGLYCLISDELAGASRAVQHLIDAGCKRPGAIVVPQRASYTDLRWRGYLDVLAKAGLEFDESLVEPADWSMEGGYLAMRQLLQRRPDVDGVFAMNDMMAIGAVGAALEADRRIPENLRIIGYDDIEFARFLHPSLSTMRVSRDEIGRRAVTILLQRMEQLSATYVVERLEPRLIIRESTGTIEH